MTKIGNCFTLEQEAKFRLQHVVHHTYLPYTLEVESSSDKRLGFKHGVYATGGGDYVGSLARIARSFTLKHCVVLFFLLKAQTQSRHNLGVSASGLEKDVSKLGITRAALGKILEELEEQALMERTYGSTESTRVTAMQVRLSCAQDYLLLNKEKILACIRWEELKQVYSGDLVDWKL